LKCVQTIIVSVAAAKWTFITLALMAGRLRLKPSSLPISAKPAALPPSAALKSGIFDMRHIPITEWLAGFAGAAMIVLVLVVLP
jgi:hypothetical protein